MEKIFDIAKDNEQSWGTLATAIDGNFEELSNEAQESNTASHISKIKDICDKRGITLILIRHAKLGEQAKGKDWQTKNSIALSLGLRYVDMYKAVTGNELTHDWYEGYLSSDGVHPTALGAKAEAMRILCDIPEITQYN